MSDQIEKSLKVLINRVAVKVDLSQANFTGLINRALSEICPERSA